MLSGFPERMTELRVEKSLSQKDAAKDLLISQALLSHYEKGIRECGLEFLCRAADYYGVTADYLLGRSESRSGLSETDLDDRAEDAIFGTASVYRAAIMAQERINSGGAPAGEVSVLLYATTLYRTMLAASRCGYIPKRWFSLPPRYADSFALGAFESLITGFPEKATDAKRRGGSQPLCIETLINTVEESIRKAAGSLKTVNTEQEGSPAR